MIPIGWNRPCYTGIHEDKFTEHLLSRYGGRDFITVSEFLADSRSALSKVPSAPGIYFVTTMHPAEPDSFLEVGTGGYFKGENPNVSISELRQKWVDGASILYIGRAGGTEPGGRTYKATLQKRLEQLLKFGSGKNIGHRGGKYLWQCEDSEDFPALASPLVWCYSLGGDGTALPRLSYACLELNASTITCYVIQPMGFPISCKVTPITGRIWFAFAMFQFSPSALSIPHRCR